jgi:hypothetical protein
VKENCLSVLPHPIEYLLVLSISASSISKIFQPLITEVSIVRGELAISLPFFFNTIIASFVFYGSYTKNGI